MKLAEQITAENPYNEENHEPESYAETIAYMYASQFEAQRDELVEALDNLMCAQNGPPLATEKQYWQSCMDKAEELIQKYKKV